MLPKRVLKVADLLHFHKRDKWQFNYGFSLTQLIFTPEDIQSRALITDDRPYSAYLGAGFSLHAKKHNVAHSLELAFGVVGPGALGEEAQNGIHELRDFPTAKGWDHGLKNEPILNAFWSTKWRYPINALSEGAFQSDILPRYGMALGNMETSANAGFTLRVGFNPPNDFANQKLSPTAYNQQFFVDRDGTTIDVKDLGIFAFAGINGKAVGQDIFLDGNTFRDSHDIKKNNFYGEFEAGLGIRWGRFKVSYTHTFVTSQYKNQNDGQGLGSIATSYSF